MSTSTTATKTPDYSVANSDVIAKYKIAGEISAKVLAEVKALCVPGAKIHEICVKGDELLEEELSKVYNSKKTSKTPKGISFPTTVSPNNIAAHYSPLKSEDAVELKKGDVAKIQLGAQIDGFAANIGETIVVGATAPVTGREADVISAAWFASEAAIRSFKAGNKNFDVTNVVTKVAKEFNCTPLDSMLTHNQERNVLTGPKEVIINPSDENKAQIATFKFEENQVYGVDILVSTSADGKVKKSELRTTIFKLTGNSYALKLKASHQALGEVKKIATHFPTSIRSLQDPVKSKMGLQECVNHQVMVAYDIMQEKEGEKIAQFFTTIAITKNGIVKLSSPSFDAHLYKSEHSIKDKQILELLSQPLKVNKKKVKAEQTA